MSNEISLLDVVKERKGGVETEKRSDDRSIGWYMLDLQMTCHRTNVLG